ncbi:ParA family protein [Rhodomicrobium sp.]|uniref:ParA family protein n=1 Tax=Rhodomicrobium sp. TaxID=2720632 RepID=UPI0039E2A4B3
MAGKVLSVVNMKGGVGKTSTVIALAETLATDPACSVLVIDVDTQANASHCIAGNDKLTEIIQADKTIDDFFYWRLVENDRRSMDSYINRNISLVTHLNQPLKISLLASSPYLRITEREIIYKLTKRNLSMEAIEGQTIHLLAPIVEQLRQHYDYIIFDCAPGISAFTTAAMMISDHIIVPTIPDFLSTLGVAAFTASILREIRQQRPNLSANVLIARKNNTRHHAEHHKIIIDKAKASSGTFGVFDTVIPESTAMAQAMNFMDGTYTQKYSKLSDVLSNLATEIRGLK